MPSGSENAPPPDAWLRAVSRETTALPEDDSLPVGFAGGRAALFWLALRTGILTILTLGLYRFWMKTRLRRWFWSAVRPGGQPLEYTGLPLEKLTGFLIAVVILAFWIGIVNLLLMFASFTLFADNTVAYAMSFAGLVPLWFYARYRARRYVLARTRWRGVRFGLLPGAWGYAWRALVYWAVTIGTAGLLWPLMTFRLEKYRTERTYFGSARFTQGGRWTMLYRAAWPLALGVLASGAALALGPANPEALPVLALSLPLALYGLVHYRVASLRMMTLAKRAGGLGFAFRPSPPRVAFIYIFGYLLSALCALLPLVLLAAAMAGFLVARGGEMVDPSNIEALTLMVSDLPRWLLIGGGVLAYFATFLLWSVLRMTFVTFPLWRHYAARLTLTGTDDLAEVSQRARDAFAEAEGFAEALDVGAAI